MIRAALYERVSTEEQMNNGISIQAQQSALEEYCKKNEIKIIGHYTDEGISGGKPANKRPAMSRLLDDVKADKIDLILFVKLDRWFRNVPEYYKTQEVLEAHHCGWKTILEDYDTTTANGRMVIGIMLSIAQQERERTSERINFVFHESHKRGEYTCSYAPHGYAIEIRDGKRYLIKDPETQEAYEAFFATLIRTKCHAEARRELLTRGIYISKKTVSEIIREGKWITGEHDGNPNFCPAYITEEQLADVQKKPIKKTQHDRHYLFTGLLICEKCGHTMKGSFKTNDTKKRGKVDYLSYRCSGREEKCPNHISITETRLEKQLIAHIDKYASDHVAQMEEQKKEQKKKNPNRLPTLREKLRRINEAYFAGNLEDEEYKTISADIKKQISQLESEAIIIPENVDKLKSFRMADYKEIYQSLSAQEKQMFWHNLVSEIHTSGHTLTNIIFKE